MKAIIRTKHLSIEAEGSDVKELFAQIGKIQEILAEPDCGLCGSENIRFNCRTVDENKYYEMICTDCGATLSFGQRKRGNELFPKRKLNREGKPDMETGTFGKHRGWTKYRGNVNDTDDAEAPQQPSPPPPASSKPRR